MSNVPLPEPHHQSAANFNAPDEPFYTADQMHAHAAAVSAAKDAEIAQLRAELIKLLADNAALRAAIDRQNNVVAPLRERVRELTTQAMFNTSTIERLRARQVTNWVHATGQTPRASGKRTDPLCAAAADEIERLRAEVAGLRDFVEHVRRNGSTHLANMAVAVLAARKGEA